ncbi:hypothetical protein Bca4012_004395 [Brassica carinata]
MQQLCLSLNLTFRSLTFRCREKQRFETVRLQTINRKLNAMNKLMMAVNYRLQKQVSHLVYENGQMKHQLDTVNSSP